MVREQRLEQEAERLVTRLPRNDLTAALDVLKKLLEMKRLTRERMHALRLLQDDPSSLDAKVYSLGIKVEFAPGPSAE